ncbi:MAG: hypothetical protein HY026_05875 [Deltaproteobacteria bacterium]|nr:hypothetical protein [Deltaproteobacteria bacterium]
MKKFLLLSAIFAVLLFAYSPAEAIVRVEGRYWFTELSSKVQASTPGLTGTEIDVINTLGMDKSKNFGEGRVELHLANHRLRYSYMLLSWEGHKTIAQSVNFAGQPYTANTRVDSKLDVVYQRVGYRYDIIDTIGKQLGIIFDFKHIGIDTNLRAPGINQSSTVAVPVPTIGLGGQMGLPLHFSISAEASGIASGGDYLIDGEASINFTPVSFAAISGGYRVFDMRVKSAGNAGNKMDFTIQGPFVTVNVEF